MSEQKCFCKKCDRELAVRDRVIVKSYIDFEKRRIRSSCCNAPVKYEDE